MANLSKYRCLFCLFFVAILVHLHGQNQSVIPILNGDFEMGEVGKAKLPQHWVNFGSKLETPPDLHGKSTHFFDCQTTAFSGDNFVGLVSRSNFTSEAMGQKLVSPLLKGHFYQVSMQLAADEFFKSQDRIDKSVAFFDAPVVLRIWGYKSAKQKDGYLLAQSTNISKTGWQTVSFTLKPTEFDCKWIVFQVWYPPEGKPVNGNLLIDAVSDLVEIELIEDKVD